MESDSVDSSPINDSHRWKKFSSIAPARLPGSALAIEPPSKLQREYESGHAEGFAEGLRLGREAGQGEQSVLLAELQNMMREVKQLRDRTVDDGLQGIAFALHALFQQVFMYELKVSPDLLAILANELRQALQAESIPKIHISSSVYESMRSYTPSTGLDDYLVVDDGLADGVIRASAGKSMLELDVMANLERVFTQACAADVHGDTQGADVDC